MAVQFYPELDETGGFYPVSGCLPFEQAISGLVFSGSGTKLTVHNSGGAVLPIDLDDWDAAYLTQGSYLYDGTEIRAIISSRRPLSTDVTGEVIIERAFTTPLTSDPLEVTRKGFQQFDIYNSGAASGTVNTITLAAQESFSANQETMARIGSKQVPLCYDATGTTFKISVRGF